MMRPEEAPVLAADVSVHYGKRCALDAVKLTFPQGTVTALVGPSGCGKSTFLQTLNRMTDLIPGCRVAGQVLLDGRDIHDPATDLLSLRRRVGMIFQKPNPFPISIRRNLELPLKEHGFRDPHQRQEILERSLEDVGLWHEVKDRLKAPAASLSGGQQQRLCIARALALSPEVILLDEPCSALDPLAAGVVEDLIDSLRRRYTVVIVTHNLPQARRLADSTALFWVVEDRGQLIEHAPTQQFFEAPEHPLARDYVNGVRG